MDDYGSIFFSSNIIIEESIEIFMWELNKVHDIGAQSLGDKENKEMIQNQLNFFINGSLVHSCALNIFSLYS